MTTLYFSRHDTDDEQNRQLFGSYAPSSRELKRLIRMFLDPDAFVLNCVLQKGHIDSIEAVAAYLCMANDICIRNCSFIGMFKANDYCIAHAVNPASLKLADNPRFRI